MLQSKCSTIDIDCRVDDTNFPDHDGVKMLVITEHHFFLVGCYLDCRCLRLCVSVRFRLHDVRNSNF